MLFKQVRYDYDQPRSSRLPKSGFVPEVSLSSLIFLIASSETLVFSSLSLAPHNQSSLFHWIYILPQCVLRWKSAIAHWLQVIVALWEFRPRVQNLTFREAGNL